MKILIRLLVLSSLISLALLVLKLRPGAEDATYSQIQKRFDQQIALLETDLTSFLEQFEVLTNPFKIQSSQDFLKRVYVNGSMIYWSDNRSIPAYSTIKDSDTLYSIKSESDVYVVRREVIPSNTALVEVFSIIPLQISPPISNEYLSKTVNAPIFGENVISFSDGNKEITHNGETILKYTITSSTTNVGDKWFPPSMLLTIILLLISIYFYFGKDHPSHRRLILAIVLILIFRFIIYVMMDLFRPHWEIFNPIYFSESKFNYSLGDLFFNVLCVFFIVAIFFRLCK
ncbi:MAG: hypothetical protein RLO12_00390, partial [Fulvivirga sp.]